MQIRRSSGGSPFSHTIFLKQEQVDQMCVDALRQSKFLPNEPAEIDIEGFIERHFEARLDFGTDLGTEVLGFAFFSPKGKPEVVGVSPVLDEGSKISDRRIRATLAHEAGHCMIHPILFMEDAGQAELLNTNVDFAKKRILCRKGDLNPTGRYDGRWWELQANYAIGGFLLPKKLVTKCVSSLLGTTGLLGLPTLPSAARQDAEKLVAQVFNVNPVVARIRLSALFPESKQMEL